MTGLAVEVEADPLENTSLRRRFPGLEAAMDAQVMAAELQRCLFEGDGLTVASGQRPRAEIGMDATCWLQYPVELRSSSGDRRQTMVIGTMFPTGDEAVSFERERLAPLAAAVSGRSAAPRPTGALPTLRLAVSVFPIHGALPTLTAATDPTQVSAILATVLPDRPVVRDAELLELRRTRGCVLRYRVDSAEHANVYGKVGETAQVEAVQRGLDELARELSKRGDPIFFPRGLGHSKDLDLSLVAEIPGAGVDLAIEREAARGVDAAARIAAFMHSTSIRTGTVRTFEDELSRAAAAVQCVARDAPDLARSLTSVLRDVAARASRSPRADICLAHGSLAPSQLMLDGERAGIVDFDRLCDAEPALDLGRFLAPLRVTLAKRSSGHADQLAATFLRRYQDWGGAQVLEDRVALYEIVALVRMAARSWLQLKKSRLRIVSSALESRVAQPGTA